MADLAPGQGLPAAGGDHGAAPDKPGGQISMRRWPAHGAWSCVGGVDLKPQSVHAGVVRRGTVARTNCGGTGWAMRQPPSPGDPVGHPASQRSDRRARTALTCNPDLAGVSDNCSDDARTGQRFAARHGRRPQLRTMFRLTTTVPGEDVAIPLCFATTCCRSLMGPEQ